MLLANDYLIKREFYIQEEIVNIKNPEDSLFYSFLKFVQANYIFSNNIHILHRYRVKTLD